MNTFQTNVNRRIIDLRFELDTCKEFRNFHRMAEIRLEIARLQGILRMQKIFKSRLDSGRYLV